MCEGACGYSYSPLANLLGDRLRVTLFPGGTFSLMHVVARDPRDRRLVYANLSKLRSTLRDMGVDPKDLLIEPDEEGAWCASSGRLLSVLDDTLVHLNSHRGSLWVLSQDTLTSLVARHKAAGEFETSQRVFNVRSYFNYFL